MAARVAVALAAIGAAVAQVPSWPQTWQMNRSTIIMTCNYSGLNDPSVTAGWTIVDVGTDADKTAE